ncbi:MAG: ATP-binding protein [Candidatus Lokiarchaeota archaeon]|nr:ATP-binding protein [Candidatus Lokiarchaeota archaeon]
MKTLKYFRLHKKEVQYSKEETARWLSVIQSNVFWEKFVKNVSNKKERVYFDFKRTYNWWTPNRRNIKQSKLEVCKDVCSFANERGGVLMIGITDILPRKIVGLEDVENKKKELHEILRTNIRKYNKVFEIVDVNLTDEKGINRTCIFIVIQQTKDVKSFVKRDGVLCYPKRESAGTIFLPKENIRQEKSRITQDNYFFLRIIKSLRILN